MSDKIQNKGTIGTGKYHYMNTAHFSHFFMELFYSACNLKAVKRFWLV